MRRPRLLALLLVGCTVPGVSLVGKSCPCSDGFVCDEATNACVQSPLIGDAGKDDAGKVPEPLVRIENLSVRWATEGGTALLFEPVGLPSDLDHYEIKLAKTEDTLLADGGGILKFGPAEATELRSFLAIPVKSPDGILRAGTILDGLEGGTSYFARGEAYDVQGHVARSAVVRLTTAIAKSSVTIFSEVPVPATSEFTISGDRPYRGQSCYAATVACADSCTSSPNLSKLDLSLKAMTAGAFLNAFVELAIAGDAAGQPVQPEILTTDLILGFNGGTGGCADAPTCRWRFSGFSFRKGGAYRLLQIPLKELVKASDQTTKLSYAEVLTQQSLLQILIVTGVWKTGSVVRVDEARIRW